MISTRAKHARSGRPRRAGEEKGDEERGERAQEIRVAEGRKDPVLRMPFPEFLHGFDPQPLEQGVSAHEGESRQPKRFEHLLGLTVEQSRREGEEENEGGLVGKNCQRARR